MVVLPTDKSGRFGIMSLENYLKAGGKHTQKDEEVGMNIIVKTQAELNGNVSMMIKFFKMGKIWNQVDRVRKTMINKSLTLCPMYLTYKDHKGWVGADGSPPPTRPIAGGNTGMNIHISEILSEIVEPMVDAYKGANEIISTEDMKAQIEILNQEYEGWSEVDWWEGKMTDCGRFVCCTKCVKSEKVPPEPAGTSDCEIVSNLKSEIVPPTPAGRDGSEGDCECDVNNEDVDNWEHFWETEEGRDSTFWTLSKEEWEKKKSETQVRRVKPEKMKMLRRQEWERRQRQEDLEDEEKLWKPEEVLEEEIQDYEKKMTIIGCDVESLYPNLEVGECGEIIVEEILRSDITWEDLDYMEGARLIVLNRSAAHCRSSPLHRVLPVRRKKSGRRPGVTGAGPLGQERGDTDQWLFPSIKLTEEEKKLIIAEVVKICTEIMFENHLYTFGGKVFRQKRGGPIGLRGTCAIARLVMANYDRKWMKLMEDNKIKINSYMRYMDDGRAFLAALKPGWRWIGGGLRFKKSWRQEDIDKEISGTEITRRVLGDSMQEVLKCLTFTTEVGEGEEEWLATLDLELRVENTNLISFRYFEKPTTTNVMVQKRSALDENSKVKILANELMRRLSNTDSRQGSNVTKEVVNRFSQKLLTSGYAISQTRRITLSGVRGWEGKKRRLQEEGKRLFRTSKESLAGRIVKKTIGKTRWFRTKKKNAKNDKVIAGVEKKAKEKKQLNRTQESSKTDSKHTTSTNKEDVAKEERTASVLFVPNTKDGILAKNLREVVERVKGILGYRIKIVERSGTPLKLMFPLTKIGEGKECGRQDCVTCTQETRGEVLPQCKKRSVVYMNICTKCNPGVGEEKHKLTPPTHPPSLYIGESSKSLYERGREHWRDYRGKHEDSHILKHHQLHHGGQGEPSFHLKPLKYSTTALNRQITEAVLIQKWGEETILNSRSEFNRCQISRLTLGEDKYKEDKWDSETMLEDKREEEETVNTWQSRRAQDRRTQEVRNVMDRGVSRSPARKRVEDDHSSSSTTKKRKQWKHEVLGEDWGETILSPPPPHFPSK